MAGLFRRMANVESLKQAWSDVLENDLEDGVMSQAVLDVAVDVGDVLSQLSEDLSSGTYTPGDLVEVRIPKKDGGTRTLHVPAPRDRVVERALLNQLSPIVDPVLGHCSYGYRPGLGVRHAVGAVVELRDEGLGWAFRGDVLDCFPSIDVPRVERLLREIIDDAEVLDVVMMLNRRAVVGGSGRRFQPGLPQGSAVAPLLCNLALVAFDAAMMAAGFQLVRYADDFVVCCATRSGAERAQTVAADALEGIGMELNQEKSSVMSFEEGFSFLGEDFGPRYPLATDERPRDPDRKTLMVAREGGRVRLKQGRVIVESQDRAELVSVPQSLVSRIVCFGAVGVSAGVRSWAFQTDVQVVFLSRKGHYEGQLLAGGAKQRASRLRAQLGLGEEHRMAIGRQVVLAKVGKQVVLQERYLREDNREELQPRIGLIKALLTQVPACGTSEELMGVEGAAARTYYEGLKILLPDDCGFTGRNRRPPLDVVNAAMSYLYTLLLGECVGALVAAGLDPAFGCLHSESRGAPALGLDLMEEFRPYIVDQVILQAARRGSLTKADEVRIEGKPGVLLTKAAKKVLIDAYELRMLRSTSGALPGFGGSIRQHVHRQAKRLAHAIHTDPAEYTGLAWR